MIQLYDLLPDFYRAEDAKLGEPLKKFLTPLQEALESVYQDELALRQVQDPDFCREDFLRWIASSLGWQYMSTVPEHQRREAREIINFHDLKGTPYAMRLLSSIAFGDLFQRLYEFYEGADSSISTIRADYEDMGQWFKHLIEGGGTFAVDDWKQAKIAERGRPYGFDRNKRLYSYCVYLQLFPNQYVPGTVRPRFLYFIRNYWRFHPAGRFCYVYITMPFFRESDEQLGDTLLEELTGTLHWDASWHLDDGLLFDSGAGPVHDSISYFKVVEFKHLDDGRDFDAGWNWDETESGVHAIIELD